MDPKNPIDAVTHRDPYPYYEHLLSAPALQYDDCLQAWIASRAAIVSEVFSSTACRVRPKNQPVPASLAGLPAGEIFGELIRMNDGAKHDRPKLALERALGSVAGAHVIARTQSIARQTVSSLADTQALSTWIFDTPLSVTADLLGFADDERAAVVSWTREFVACFSPSAATEQIAAGSEAASLLRSRMQSLLQSTPRQNGSLLARVREQAEAVGWSDSAAIIANLVGTLTQTCEATAGLIGNAIVAIAVQPHLLDEVRRHSDGWAQLVHETSRCDPPVQNTRRFVVENMSIDGIIVQPGSAILLVLAAANRDPNANLRPREFLLQRPNRCVFTFSRGAHSCPGENLARSIAATALAVLFESLPSSWFLQLTWSWRPSANVRVPVFRA